jgi:hypothetical protein
MMAGPSSHHPAGSIPTIIHPNGCLWGTQQNDVSLEAFGATECRGIFSGGQTRQEVKAFRHFGVIITLFLGIMGFIAELDNTYGFDVFIKLTVDTSRVLMSKAATNNICSNKHKA